MVNSDGAKDSRQSNEFEIKRGILDKIQQFTNMACDDFSRLKIQRQKEAEPQGTAPKGGAEGDAETVESLCEKNVNVWKINEFMVVIGETQSQRTEYFSKKNNIDHINNYLMRAYQKKHIVYAFRKTKLTKSFKRSLVFEGNRFSVDQALEIARISKFIVDNMEGTVIVVEMRSGHESTIIFLISCILAYCKFYWSAESAFNSIRSFNPLNFTFLNNGTILRQLRYFDKVSSLSIVPTLSKTMLNQVIISTIPKIIPGKNFRPILKILSNAQEKPLSIENSYFDENHLIFSNVNIEIFADCKISLFFEQEGINYHVLDLSINTLFYQQGLYRFNRFEIETSLPQGNIYKFFDENFYLDLVMIEAIDSKIKNPFLETKSLVDVMENITQRVFNDFNEAHALALKTRGYDSVFSLFCAQNLMADTDIEALFSKISQDGQKHLSKKFEEETKPDAESCSEESRAVIIVRDTGKPDYHELYENDVEIACGEVELLDDRVEEQPTPSKKARSSLFVKKKSVTSEMSINEEYASVRPFHWTIIKQTEGTIFQDLPSLGFKIDARQFQDFFCRGANEAKPDCAEKEESQCIISQKRLFLISLSIRNLELNHTTPESIRTMLEEGNTHLFAYEDLLNLSKVLPEDENERNLLLSVPAEALSSLELAILGFVKIPEIYSILEILKFEHTFFEDIEAQFKALEKLYGSITKILESKDLKCVLRMVLQLGNMVNYTYSKSRKFTEGFRMESLQLLNCYYGNNGRVLIDFLKDEMDRNHIVRRVLYDRLQDVHTAKNEDLALIKAKINELISEYRRISGLCDEIKQYKKEKYQKFISYACRQLRQVSTEYKKVVEKARFLKKQFGEDESAPVSIILGHISDFMTRIHK